jgi:hypothetical protein
MLKYFQKLKLYQKVVKDASLPHNPVSPIPPYDLFN